RGRPHAGAGGRQQHDLREGERKGAEAVGHAVDDVIRGVRIALATPAEVARVGVRVGREVRVVDLVDHHPAAAVRLVADVVLKGEARLVFGGDAQGDGIVLDGDLDLAGELRAGADVDVRLASNDVQELV